MKKRYSVPLLLRTTFFSRKIRVFSKKKKKGLHFDFISDFPPKIKLFKKGPQSESFSEGNVAANNLHTAIIVRKAVSTTTFAYFRGAPDKVSRRPRAPRRTVWEPLHYKINIELIIKFVWSTTSKKFYYKPFSKLHVKLA